ncbi:MAG: hypothetical protein HRT77_17780 [Halioglobus sp.]|nr:hypothetical protein [Halioglobus sp.]
MNRRFVLCFAFLVIDCSNSVSGAPSVAVRAMPEPGWIAVQVDYGKMGPLPEGASIQVQLLGARRLAISRQVERLRPEESTISVVLDVAGLQPGGYLTRTAILSPAGEPIGEPAEMPVTWTGRSQEFQGVRILNNVVWELMRVDKETIDGTRTYLFNSPKRRWVYVAAIAGAAGGPLRLSLDDYGEILSFDNDDTAVKEAMRYLPKGTHELVIDAPASATLDSLVVRSIPELILHELSGLKYYNGIPDIPVLEFYDTYVLNNMNTLIADVRNPTLRPVVEKWRQKGSRVLVNTSAKGVAEGIEYCPPEELVTYISSSTGYTSPLADGTMLDEFSGPCVNCPSYAAALRALKTMPTFKNKLLYFYDTNIEFNDEQARTRLRAVVATDSVIMWERYLGTGWDKFLPHPSEAAARNFLKTEYGLVGMARTCRRFEPQAIEHLAVCFGFFSTPGGHTLSTTPYVNHKVFLDMQFNVVANDPAFWGTYGLMGYHSSYSDEETLRWISRLFRHYGIEGNTQSATNDSYRSSYLSNGDFVDGTVGWSIMPAEQGSIETARLPGLSRLQARYGSSEGDTGLVTTRSVKGPNRITQEIKNLEPGKLYTFRMIACDFNDQAKREKPAVSVKLANVKVLPDKSFATIFPDASFVDVGDQKTWLTYYWYLFRARDQTARVTITDWAADDLAGGPIGQQLIFNYIQVHPYYPTDELMVSTEQ